MFGFEVVLEGKKHLIKGFIKVIYRLRVIIREKSPLLYSQITRSIDSQAGEANNIVNKFSPLKAGFLP